MAGYIGSKSSVTQVDGYNRTEADAEFVAKAGGTMTGALTGTDIYLSGGVYLGGTGAANKLDDYEEGTFTPVVKGTLSDPSVTYGATRYGGYVKIGRQVTLSVNIVTTALSGGSGGAAIGGLPFTPSSDKICHTGALETDTTTLTSNYTYAYVAMFANNALIYFRQGGSGQNEIEIPVGNLTANAWQRVSITYFTDS